MSTKQSDSFAQNRFFWTFYGLWPGKIPNKYYRYFSIPYLLFTFVIYNALLTINLYYTPRKIDKLIREIIFFFTEIAIVFKVYVVIFKRQKLTAVFDMLDCDEFQGTDDTGKEIVRKYNDYYKTYLKSYTVLCNATLLSQILLPVFGFLIFKNTLELPICNYYFLSDKTRDDYFNFIFLYQSLGMYGHMMYNANIDTLIVGYIMLAIAQIEVILHDLQNLKVDKMDASISNELMDLKQQRKLRKIIHHHELVLEYCEQFQDVIGWPMLIQFGIGSVIVCVSMCGLLLMPASVETYMFMVGYFIAMNLEIFAPAWLSTQLKYGSHELMTAAYISEWLPRSERYKSSLKLFVERAKQPIIITGLKMFPLSLPTYISIMKTAYSCFAMVRILQDRQESATRT